MIEIINNFHIMIARVQACSFLLYILLNAGSELISLYFLANERTHTHTLVTRAYTQQRRIKMIFLCQHARALLPPPNLSQQQRKQHTLFEKYYVQRTRTRNITVSACVTI